MVHKFPHELRAAFDIFYGVWIAATAGYALYLATGNIGASLLMAQAFFMLMLKLS